MANTLEGRGYLLQDGEMIGHVHYRLRWERDGWGQSMAQGELWTASSRNAGAAGESFVIHTEDGFTLPLQLTGEPGKQGQPFRKLFRREVAEGVK